METAVPVERESGSPGHCDTMGPMTAADASRRPRRAFWGDARFFLGVLLIVASVAGVWFVVSAGRETSPAYAAAHALVPGQPITSADLRTVEVGLGTVGAAYIPATQAMDGLVATRAIAAGELIPAAAVGAASDARTTRVVLRSAIDVPASAQTGTTVEVWAAPLVESGRYDQPRILVADATVVSVDRDGSMIGGGAASLELVIPRADVAAVLAATADEALISVVPIVGGGS